MSETQVTGTETTDETVPGPIDYLLMEFPADADTSAAAAALQDLVARDLVRIFDILVIRKALDGSCSVVDAKDLTAEGLGSFQVFAGARSGLIGDEDVAQAAEALEPGMAAALLVYENTWARAFVRGALQAGGQVVASGRIPVVEVMEALDALEGVG
jgi:hypothetical protein